VWARCPCPEGTAGPCAGGDRVRPTPAPPAPCPSTTPDQVVLQTPARAPAGRPKGEPDDGARFRVSTLPHRQPAGLRVRRLAVFVKHVVQVAQRQDHLDPLAPPAEVPLRQLANLGQGRPTFHARSVIQHLNATKKEGRGPLIYPAKNILPFEVGALVTPLGPGNGKSFLHTLTVNLCKWVCQQHSLSRSSCRPIRFQFLATGTKLGHGEHGYVAFLFVNFSYGIGPCCSLFFSYRLSSADALGV